MISRGLLVGGDVIPSTSDVLRSSKAWWPDGSPDTRDRQGAAVELYVQHWTGGHPHSDGEKLHRGMVGRMSDKVPGKPLDCAVNFGVGWDGSIWQLADVLTACVHVGDRAVIRRSVSTEHCWPGTRRWAERLGYREGPWRDVRVGGRMVEIMEPSREMMAASLRLAELLAAIDHPMVRIPRIVPATNARMSYPEIRRRRGAVEHGQMAGSTKIDCVGVCNDNLAQAGWERG